MADSVAEVCNQALSHLGERGDAVTDIDSPSNKQERHCNILYPSARNFVLAAFDWHFARKFIAMSEAVLEDSEHIGGWTYAYTYPSDCAAPRKIYEAIETVDGIDWDVMLKFDNSARYILTDQEDAVLVYTGRVSDVTLWPPAFEAMVSWKLASDLAMPITSDINLAKSMMAVYAGYNNIAEVIDAKSRSKTKTTRNRFITVRG